MWSIQLFVHIYNLKIFTACHSASIPSSNISIMVDVMVSFIHLHTISAQNSDINYIYFGARTVFMFIPKYVFELAV